MTDIEAGFLVLFGYTSYLIDFDWGSSRLEFPVSSAAAGIDSAFQLTFNKSAAIDLNLAFYINIMNPYLPMVDEDWVAYDFPIPDFKFSYTESESVMLFLYSDLSASYCILPSYIPAVYLNAGYSFQYIQHDIMGYSGWQYDLSSTYESYNVSGTGNVLDYMIILSTIQAGAGIGFKKPFQARIDANLLFIFLSDRDDHILRRKESTSEGLGFGIKIDADIKFPFKSEVEKPVLYISGKGSLTLAYSELEQTQYWYGDDPATTGMDDTGTTLSGIDNSIDIFQYHLGIYMGISF